jgi:mannose-1-phosphate guanylyltransferase
MNYEHLTPRALILAGGNGKRLAPITDFLPKCLVNIGGKPLLDRWHTALRKAGVQECTINVHKYIDQFSHRIALYNYSAPPKWRIFEEPVLLGTAGTLSATLDWLECSNDFFVIYADNLSGINLKHMLDVHRQSQSAVTVALFHTDNPSQCGIVELDGAGRIIKFTEKPQKPETNIANAGIYIFQTGVLAGVLDGTTKDISYDVLPKLVGGTMHGFVLDGYHRDIGNLISLKCAREDVNNGRINSPL